MTHEYCLRHSLDNYRVVCRPVLLHAPWLLQHSALHVLAAAYDLLVTHVLLGNAPLLVFLVRIIGVQGHLQIPPLPNYSMQRDIQSSFSFTCFFSIS